MNPIDQQLHRLLRSAAQARPEKDYVPAYGLDTRALAAWHSIKPFDLWDMSLLVRGLLLASLITAVSLWPVMSKSSNPFTDYLQLADSTVQVDNAP